MSERAGPRRFAIPPGVPATTRASEASSVLSLDIDTRASATVRELRQVRYPGKGGSVGAGRAT